MLRLTVFAAVLALLFALSPFTGTFAKIDSSAAIPVFHR